MIIGRKREIQRLNKAYHSTEAEFIVLYGRRRVGKTFLIREYFSQKDCLFLHATGVQQGSMQTQLTHFAGVLAKSFTQGIEIQPPTSWEHAFKILDQFIAHQQPSSKVVIFLDELPWMATRKAGLLQALDYYWNRYWSMDPKIILVVCGSSAAWLIQKIIYNRGGLHNRCTCEIKLEPFNLLETHDYLHSRGVKLSKRHVLTLYLALGGIPYYLRYLEPGLSAVENIQKILFDKNAPLKDEFKKLFDSLFTQANIYVALIKYIAQAKEGMSRAKIAILSKHIFTGGRLTQYLDNLIETGFIEKYIPWNKKRNEYYKVTDEFCLFYIHWLLSHKGKLLTAEHWLTQHDKPAYHSWAGNAFEAVCRKHIQQIIDAFHIKTAESISSWQLITRQSTQPGAQIDLLIERSDDAITLCEIKYTDKIFVIDKAYAENLQRKIDVFKNHTKTEKHIFMAMVSANGLKKNKYVEDLITNVATLDDLFH
jgi:uncharacterized protein